MSSPTVAFREAVRGLNREKKAAYRDAWKRRGEILSIVANIARKVDRVQYVLDGAPSTAEETVIDTAIDLFIYCLKYQTFLADLDGSAAARLFGKTGVRGPYSDGTEGFEQLLPQANLGGLDAAGVTVRMAASGVLSRFGELEACFSGLDARQSAVVRLHHAEAVTEAAIRLIGTLRQDHSSSYRQFFASRGVGSE